MVTQTKTNLISRPKPKVKFQQWTCDLYFRRYGNDRISIHLMDFDEPIAMATVNVPHFPLAEDEVLIKSYSENEGMLNALIEAGIVKPTGVKCRTGHAEVHVCKLLIYFPPVSHED